MKGIDKDDLKFLMSDVYDYLFENSASIGTNFCKEFPNSWIDEDKGIIHICKNNIEVFTINAKLIK